MELEAEQYPILGSKTDFNSPKGNSVDPYIILEKIMNSNGDIYIRKYLKGKQLGRGGFAKCFEVTDMQTKIPLAAKIIPRNSLQKERHKQKLISEIKIHKSLHHPNIVNFEHVFEDKENVYILLELCTNQTMNDLIKRRKRLTELEVQNFLVQIINGLKYLHQNKVIHRDLKLGNFFLTEKMELKIGDFGLATKIEYDGERKKTICGTPNYIAPEVLDGKNGHSFEADIWSLGVIIYTLIIGKAPFETSDIKTTYKKIKNNDYCFPENVAISENAKDLIKKILNLDASKRPTLDEIIDHSFLLNAPKIPKFLPTSILNCPPSLSYLKQYIPNYVPNYTNIIRITQQPQRIIDIENDYEEKPIEPVHKNVIHSAGNNNSKEEVFVENWIDFSERYGIGYLLSNGTFGAYFNDATNLIMKDSSNFFFQEKKSKEQNKIYCYDIQKYPNELAKKLKLFNHFQTLMPQKENNNEEINESNLIYIKYWMKQKSCVMFLLNTRIIQFEFIDKTTLIINKKQKLLSYIDVNKEKKLYPLNSALQSSNMEMTKRLRYATKIYNDLLLAKKKYV